MKDYKIPSAKLNMEFDIIENLKAKLREMFKEENTGHDISHLERVLEIALIIQKNEGGDLYVVAVSALVHDVHRLMSGKLGRFVSPQESIEDVKRLLLDSNVDEEKLEAILDVVRNHDNKSDKNQSLETLIIQDADALDAIGEIGLKRTLKYCKTHNIPLTNSQYPLDSKEYIPDINPLSTCHYIYNTMIPEGKNLYTKTAQELSKDKIEILENFIEENMDIKMK